VKTIVCVLASWLALLAGAPAGQQLPTPQPPTFRTEIDAVQIDISVLDKDRRPIRGLTAADFTVLEDGQPRRIVAFQAIELPPVPATPPAGAASIAADVSRNDLPDGRLVVILLDPFLQRVMVPGRVTIADPPGLTALRATARAVVDSLAPGDLAAVGHTFYGTPQNFTTDHARLKRAIDASAFGTNKRAEGEEWGNCHCGTCRLEAITRVAAALQGEPQRRKSVFFIGERVQLAPVPGPCNTYLEPATRKMVQATQLANVTVHTIDPNALETTNVHAGDDFKPDAPISEAAASQEKANRAHLIERQQSLQTVADWTGGRAVLNTNVPEASVRPILDESSAYYLLAFQTSEVKRDGRFHPITVRVNRADVQVRTRKGYYADPIAPAAEGPVSLDALSRSLLPERGLPMSITAAPFRSPGGTPVVVVATGVRTAAMSGPVENRGADAEARFEPIEVLTSAFRDGKKDVDWQRQRFSVAIPETPPGELRYEAVSTLNLEPGAYELRVAVRHEPSGILGSVHTFVDVPDFGKDPLTLSGVVLHDAAARTATPAEALGGVIDVAPTTRREFTTAHRVVALVRAYERRSDESAAVNVTFRVLDEQLREVLAEPMSVPADRFAADGSAEVRFNLPLDKLQPGAFVLRVDATRGSSTARREVPFTVR
jgi:VWFA-related protein